MDAAIAYEILFRFTEPFFFKPYLLFKFCEAVFVYMTTLRPEISQVSDMLPRYFEREAPHCFI
jgi:hypothetical protein